MSLPVDSALAPDPTGLPVTVQVAPGVTAIDEASNDPLFVNTTVVVVIVAGVVGSAPGLAIPPRSFEVQAEFKFVVIPFAVFGLDKHGVPPLTTSSKVKVPLEKVLLLFAIPAVKPPKAT